MILKYFKAKKSKKILLKTLKSLLMEYVKRAEEPTERAPNGQSWKNLSNKINQVVLDYNPKQKIHDIHVPIIEQINKWQRRGNSHLEKFQLIYVDALTSQHVFVVTPLCPPLCNLMDCSLPVSSVHGISQARIPEWVVISFSRGPPDPWIKLTSPLSPALQADSLWAEPSGNPLTSWR